MRPRPQEEPGRGLDLFEPPTHAAGFWPALERQLAGGRQSGPPEPTGPRRWLRPAFAAAAAAIACALLALGLAGLPGTPELGPQPAGAVGRLLARVDAGLARVRTVQGTMITAGADGRAQAAPFAVTARGDSYADQPEYVPKRVILGHRQTYRRELADMRAGRQPWNGRQLRADRAVLVRLEAAGDAAARVAPRGRGTSTHSRADRSASATRAASTATDGTPCCRSPKGPTQPTCGGCPRRSAWPSPAIPTT